MRKSFRDFTSVTILLLIISFPFYTQLRRYCPTDTYSTWLSSQAKRGPADLVTEQAVETKQQKFDLSYALINVGDDVIQVQVELYRYLDEDAMNEGWKLEQTKSFTPPFAESTSVVFRELKKGKTYGIHLLATTNIPVVASDGVFPPDTISIKTVYFLWDKDNGTHVSATSSITEDKKKFFKVAWGASNCPDKAKIRVKHLSGNENPVIETAAPELVFPEAEFVSWPIDDASEVSADTFDASGNIIGTTELPIRLEPPCIDCLPIPCIAPPPEDPNDELLATTTFTNGIITAVIQSNYGGAIKSLKWIGDNRELVDNQDDGVDIQVDAARVNELWVNHGYVLNNRELWESREQPSCAHKPASWLPTQGGSQPGCGSSNSSWIGKYYRYDSTSIDSFWGWALPPKLGTDSAGPYMYFTKDFPNWIPMNNLSSTYDKYKGQAFPVMSAEYHFANPTYNGAPIPNVSGLQLKSKFRLTCPCAYQTTSPPCWCKRGTQYEYNSYGVYTKGHEFDAIIHSWYFFGSSAVQTTFRYNPQDATDPYYLSAETPCIWGDEGCAANYGWKDNNYFAPFSLLRTTNALNGKYIWILIYQVENGSAFTDKRWELARVLRFQHDSYIKGSVHMPFYIIREPSIITPNGAIIPPFCSNCGLKTTSWVPSPSGEWITTYVILGTKRNNVLCALYQLSGGKWPKVRTGKPLPCQALNEGF